MGIRTLLTIFFVLSFLVTFGQADTINRKAVLVSKKHLTYLWTGRAHPDFIDTKSKYGFKIKCKGCRRTGRIIRHNRRVVSKINKVYGENWFEENMKFFY